MKDDVLRVQPESIAAMYIKIMKLYVDGELELPDLVDVRVDDVGWMHLLPSNPGAE